MKYLLAPLSAAVILAISGLTIPASSASNAMNQAHSVPPLFQGAQPKAKDIVGTWLATFDGGVHVGFVQWQKGGTVWKSMDFNPKIGNVLLGNWKANNDGSFSYVATGWTYDDTGDNRTGTFTESETVTLSGGGYSGSFHVQYFDLQGNITFDHTGTLTAVPVSRP